MLRLGRNKAQKGSKKIYEGCATPPPFNAIAVRHAIRNN